MPRYIGLVGAAKRWQDRPFQAKGKAWGQLRVQEGIMRSSVQMRQRTKDKVV